MKSRVSGGKVARQPGAGRVCFRQVFNRSDHLITGHIMAEDPEEYEESDEADDLQFSSAEPGSPGPPPAGPTCVVCHRPITDVYFAAGDKIVCNACRNQYETAVRSGSKVGRMAIATLLGSVAGVIGAAIWFGIRHATDREFGLVAIGVGLLVGGSVRYGSGGRGGRGYQILAVLLTYLAVGMNYAPDFALEFYHKIKEDHQKSAQTSPPTSQYAGISATRSAAMKAPSTTQSVDETASSPSGNAGTPHQSAARPSGAMMVLGVLLLLAIAIAMVLLGPVIAGFSSIIGAVIVAIALWEAWKINAGRRVVMMGPYTLANRPLATQPPLPPLPPLQPPPGTGQRK
jgi:hypothetical protein